MMSEQKMINAPKSQWLLIASLILNLFFMGAIAGGAYKLFSASQTPLVGKVGQNALRFAAENLTNEQQRSFKKTLREARREAKPLFQASKDARIEVRKLISEQNFDRDAVLTALAKTREADRAVRIHMEERLVSFAQTLSAEDRQKLAEGLANKGPLRTPPVLKD